MKNEKIDNWLIVFLLIFFPLFITGQDLEIEGMVKIGTMDSDNTADQVVVRLADSTLAIRGVSTIYQILSISNDTIYLTNGGFVKLPADQVNDADSDPANELQNWTNLPGIPAGFADDVDDVADNDNDATNELQDLSLNMANDTLSLSDDATGVDLSMYKDNTDDQGLSLGVKAGTMQPVNIEDGTGVTIDVADNDNDATNELQDLSLNMTTNVLSLTDDASTVDLTMYKELPQSPTTGEMLYWNGTAWVSVAPGSTGQVLNFVNGEPVWGGSVSLESGEVRNPVTGAIWMDQNLGASQVATGSTDAASYGDLYQWGRDTDGHEDRASSTTTTLSGTDSPGHGDFITTSSSPDDWRNPQNDNLWQGVSGTNNPCPAGYRLPTEAEWEAERLSWSSNNAAGAFSSPLKLPVAGLRLYSDGSLQVVGFSGGYWSSTVSSSNSRRLFINSINSFMSTDKRALGYSVRCIKD